MKGLVRQLGAAACIWGAAAVLYGVEEAVTNAAVGLYLPADVLGAVFLIYGVLGAVTGVAVGASLLLWRRRRGGDAASPAPVHMAGFLAGLLLVYAGIRINDRLLPDLVSALSLGVNVVLVAAGGGLAVLFHRHLRPMSPGRRAVAFVFLVLAVGAFVSVGLDVDTFVIPTLSEGQVVLLYVALAAACALGYAGAAWTSQLATARSAGRRAIVATGTAVGIVVALTVSLSRSSVERAASTATASPAAPNVVWIVLDTTRADHLGAYGYPRATTPHVDQAAAEGAVFETAIAGSSWTIPSHFQMVTGRMSAGERKILDADFTTAAEAFARRGYRTGAVLANQSLGRLSGFEQGFQSFVDAPPVLLYLEVLEKLPVSEMLVNYRLLSCRTVLRLLYRKTMMMSGRAQADVISGHVVDWLRRQDGSPFFLFVNYMDPHEPYDPPGRFRGRFKPGVDPEEGFIRYDRASGKIISSEEFTRDIVPRMTPAKWEDLIALYDEELAFMDDGVGTVIAELRRLGVYDRTILVVTADHGELFGEHGLATHFKSLSEEEIHVPLVIRYPPRIPAGTRIGAQVQLVDVLPTVLDAAGIEATDPMDGRSLLPFVAAGGGEPTAVHEEIYSFLLRKPDRQLPHTAAGDLVAIRTPRSKYVWSSTGRHAYYDLASDPKENRNLYGDGSQLADAAGKVDSWRHSIGLDAVDRKMDRLTTDRLRSLGYIR